MADEAVETAPEVVESEAPPAPKISEPSQKAELAPKAQDDSAILQKFQAMLDERDQRLEKTIRGLQSGVDKRVAPLEGLARYLSQDQMQALEEAQNRATLDEIIAERRSGKPQPVDHGRSAEVWETEWQTGSQKILDSALEDFGVKIERTDADYQSLMRSEFNSPPEAFAALNKLVARRVKQGNAPAAAAASEGMGNPTGGSLDVADISKNLEIARQKRDWKTYEALSSQLKEALGQAS